MKKIIMIILVNLSICFCCLPLLGCPKDNKNNNKLPNYTVEQLANEIRNTTNNFPNLQKEIQLSGTIYSTSAYTDPNDNIKYLKISFYYEYFDYSQDTLQQFNYFYASIVIYDDTYRILSPLYKKNDEIVISAFVNSITYLSDDIKSFIGNPNAFMATVNLTNGKILK